MTALEVLKAAREKIADRSHWTKGELARNSKGKPVPVNAASACRWCSEGAIRACGGEFKVIQAFAHLAGIESVWLTNDNLRHSEVLALFDRAIASEEAKVTA